MDDRKRAYRNAVSACLGIVSIISFTVAIGRAGLGKPKEAAEEINVAPVLISNSIGHELKHMDEAQLRTYLSARGFKTDAILTLHELRRAVLANFYQGLFDSTSVRCGISQDVLFAYFIMEATKEGVESSMFLATWNPGGVKHRGVYSAYYAYDDCKQNGKAVPCAFENPGSFENAVELWASVFNAARYSACKNLPIEATCKCLEQAGYHTAKNYRQRARIAKSYQRYLSFSPNAWR